MLPVAVSFLLFEAPQRALHLGFSGPATRVDKLARREIRFPGGLKDPVTLSFRWMSGLHAIEIPFTLADIRIP